VRVLPDTSVWVDYLRGRDPAVVAALDSYLDRESVLICGPVVAELLAGTAPSQLEELWLAVGSLPWADLDRAGWREVGRVAGHLRRSGVSVAFTDVTIAVATVRSDADLWTRDRDFERIHQALPALRLHSPSDSAPER
jgi:predicted nucleic acid-binding protein